MPSSFESSRHISVFETTLSIQQNTLSVFNIIIQTSHSTVSLIRYPFDLLEFHQKIRFHYPRSKISFPSLSNPPRKSQQQHQLHQQKHHHQQQGKDQHTLRYSKRRSFLDLLPFSRKKSNASKVEKYLERCFQHPIIGISSILRDFTSVQRDEDATLTSQHTSTTLIPTVEIKSSADNTKFTGPLPPLPSSTLFSCSPLLLPSSQQQQQRQPQQQQIHLPLIQVNAVNKPLPKIISSTTPLTSLAQQTPSPTLGPCIVPAAITTAQSHIPSDITLADYDLLKVLGKGCMGKVLLVRSKRNEQLYALKSIKKKWVMKQKELIHTRAERDILVRLRNQPFLAQVHHVFQTPSELFLVLEYYPGGDIATQLSNISCFDEERTKFYAAEIVYGLGILHEHGIVYRDLKPENVLIGRDGHIILTDFGLSKIFTEQDVDEYNVPSTQTFCGTAEYLAPEILLGETYTFVVDFWSLGTLLYEMLAGTTPYWADTHMEMYKRVLEDSLEFPSNFDPITCSFLTGLLEKEACERLGWGEDGIEEIKAHPYFDFIKDWKHVGQHKLKPPYIPFIQNEQDISHFDDMFTGLPVKISQSSHVNMDEQEQQQDPFEGFSFNNVPQQQTIFQHDSTSAIAKPPFIDTSNSTSTVRIRKRHSAALLSFTSSPSPNSNNHQLFEDNRVIKKRQTNITSAPFAAQNETEEEHEEDQSSIYSRSSLSFSFAAQEATTATRAGSELSIDPIQTSHCTIAAPYERPQCPLPGQQQSRIMLTSERRGASRSSLSLRSNASTLNDSVCSYLTLENNVDSVSQLQQLLQPFLLERVSQ
ncbi:Ser/Thr protein kinase [Mucor ambiguus]|uniref:Ser/Thr protein kinase n=1 Tax=Mucor ambiguus TaxID=91626 RepID=A0A0C9MR74_9FUNG|nr:Ser/Thr protein kinase [Mucor ambiguus]